MPPNINRYRSTKDLKKVEAELLHARTLWEETENVNGDPPAIFNRWKDGWIRFFDRLLMELNHEVERRQKLSLAEKEKNQ